jgi:5-formyltetrahydrofolate cyclo-ligase
VVDTLGKPAWRERLLAARARLTQDALDAAAVALARRVSGLSGTVCAYRPVGAEPGASLLLPALLDAGCRVLLPVVVRRRPLEWAEYTGPSCLEPAAFGLLEPSGPRLGSGAVLAADTVLVPALAVDRSGVRLGRGGGYYDRSLPGARGRLVAVLHDSELVDVLPREPHDVLMTATLTPSLGITAVRPAP